MRDYDSSATTYGIGFEVGFDTCRYGLFLEDFEEHDEALKNGYDSARTQNVSRIKPDKFEKKLLQIRRRAFRKGIPVSITIDDIKNALSLTNCECPVLKTPLTFNTGNDTDWSVDRLDNDLGYLPGNIFVMSSEANKAKGDVSLEDIVLFILNLDEEVVSRQPRLEMFDKTFWQNLYIAIFDRMPLEMFCKKAHEYLADETSQKNVRDQVLMELVTSAVDDYGNPLSIKSYDFEIKNSELIGTVLPIGFFSRAELTKLRKSSLRVLEKIKSNYNSTANAERRKGIQDWVCSEFIAIKRNLDYVSKIERRIKEVKESPVNCGLILGVMTQRHREYGF